jgi:predicted dehydrogenase
MVGVGIIGCGNISRFHHEGYAKAGARIVHAADVRIEAAKAVADKYGAKASADDQAVLDDPEVDIVSVLTFASTHKEICLAAIAAGKGVVCEKTLTANAADSAEIARAAEKAGTFFATAYMKRYFPAMQKAKELLADMGQLMTIYARSWQPAGEAWTAPLDPSQTNWPSPVVRNYGGGCLVCCGSHILDLLHWFGGRPSRIAGDLYVREGMDSDLQSNALLWFENGGIGHFEANWHPLAYAGYERNGWDERLEINAIGGRLDVYTVQWDHPENNGALLVHQDAKTGETTEYRYRAMNPFHAEMAEMIRRYEAGEQPMPSAWDGYVVDETIAQIMESSATKTVVEVKWADR